MKRTEKKQSASLALIGTAASAVEPGLNSLCRKVYLQKKRGRSGGLFRAGSTNPLNRLI